ncbi:transposase [Acetobacter cerevisiae DSM 14362]|nr:transposase [Acetobacter cerevisiae DSM 14362]
MDFEAFRPDLDKALAYADGSKGGRQPFDPVLMFKILVIQTLNTLSYERTEYLINDRLSFMRFLGLGLSNRVPDAKTVWLCQKRLTEAGAIQNLFERFDAAMAATPKQRNINGEKADLRKGRIPESWEDKPVKLSHKDRHARWTLKFTKAKRQEDGTLGYKSHISIDRRFGFIRGMAVTSASAADGRLLRLVVSTNNTSSEVWADSAYRSRRNEKWLSDQMLTSRIHRRKPMSKPMSKATARANAAKSSIRAHVEHVFAHQKTGSTCSSAPSASPALRRN